VLLKILLVQKKTFLNLTSIYIDAAVDGFIFSTGIYVRCHFTDMSIYGSSISLNGINTGSALVYETTIRNIAFNCGGSGVYMPKEFFSHFQDCEFSSINSLILLNHGSQFL